MHVSAHAARLMLTTHPPCKSSPKAIHLEHACDLGHLHPLAHTQAIVVRLHGLEQDPLVPAEVDIYLGFRGF